MKRAVERIEECPSCDGTGEIEFEAPCSPSEATGGLSAMTGTTPCETCEGRGQIAVEVEDPRTN